MGHTSHTTGAPVTLESGDKWLQDCHWEQRQVTITIVDAPGAQNLGVPVGVGLIRRIRSLKIRNAGTQNTVVSLLVGTVVVDSWDIPAQTTRIISDQDGWKFVAGEQTIVQTSSVDGGNTYVSARGVEA